VGRDYTVSDAIALQRVGCAAAGSELYARLLDGLSVDYAAGGVTAALLDGRTDRPVHDALVLRLLGAVHRIVLEGRAPALARFYPSVGGHRRADPTPAFLDAVIRHRAEVLRGLGRGVQTNEVGRAAVLAPGFALIARRAGLPLRLLEVGSSAGLLLRWDHYRYVTAGAELGDPASTLVFDDAWVQPVPDLSGPVEIAERRGCDLAPIDVTTTDGRLTLLSFVWPDQEDRFIRLRAALDIALAHPVDIDRADAAAWVEVQLPHAASGLTTVVFHSIVLQYLTPADRRRMRDAISRAGASATASAPLAWLRMEPAGPSAELRLTWWPGGREERLASCGYHGQEVRWGAADDSRSGPPARTTAKASRPHA
jgi:hypothetical protein